MFIVTVFRPQAVGRVYTEVGANLARYV